MRSRGSGMELLAPGALGSGGVTKRPWWPQELLELLHESAVAQIEQGYLTPATVTYLNRVAQSKPKFAPVIRDNLKKMSIGYYNETSQKNKPVME